MFIGVPAVTLMMLVDCHLDGHQNQIFIMIFFGSVCY